MGALTSKIYAFQARPWELRKEKTYNIFDSYCSEIIFEIRGMEIRRVLPTPNDSWLPDKIRKIVDSFEKMRIYLPKIRFYEENQSQETSWEESKNLLKNYFNFLIKIEKRRKNKEMKKKGKRNQFIEKELEKNITRMETYEKMKRRNYSFHFFLENHKKYI